LRGKVAPERVPRKVTDSYSGPATIVSDARALQVTCHYSVSTDYPAGLDGPPGLVSWRGQLSANGSIESGEASIRLPDGRERQILVGRVTIGVTAGTFEGSFVGNGPPP
jgi:hypothetical protein